MKTAKISFQNQLFEARGGDFLDSPVKRLIEFIYRDFTDSARYILREPIWLNYEPSQYEQALIKVGAKRYRVGELIALQATPVFATSIDFIKNNDQTPVPTQQKFGSLSETINWFRELAEQTGVLAAYISADYRLVEIASNTNSIIKTQHAEMNLIEKLKRVNQAEGDFIVVSLQSCRMCAAALSEWLVSNQTPVYYLKAEENLKNVKTALFQREHWLRPDQNE